VWSRACASNAASGPRTWGRALRDTVGTVPRPQFAFAGSCACRFAKFGNYTGSDRARVVIEATAPVRVPAASSSALGARRWTRALRTVAQDTLIEAFRGRWLWMTLLGAFGVAIIATFVHGLALAEQQEVGLSFAAPLARLAAVIIVALSAISSVAREQSDGSLLLALAAPLSRVGWLLGKILAFFALAALTAIILVLPIIEYAPSPVATFAWWTSLTMELAIVASVSLAIGIVLTRIPLAVCALLGFYALARDAHILQLLATRAQSYSQFDGLATLVHGATAIFPRLDLFTRTDWLLNAAPGAATIALLALQSSVYCALALTVAALDLRRTRLG